jgi:hypothetical protein
VAKKAEPTILLPRAISDEIADAARRTHRSVSFIVARALAAAKDAAAPPPDATSDGELAPLVLTSDEDDPPNALKAAQSADPQRLASAWRATRARFAAWIAREEAAQANERADDLDTGLHDASDGKTAPARLVELARSEYVRVRALVAVHPQAPAEALQLLAEDRDRVVRQALQARQ